MFVDGHPSACDGSTAVAARLGDERIGWLVERARAVAGGSAMPALAAAGRRPAGSWRSTVKAARSRLSRACFTISERGTLRPLSRCRGRGRAGRRLDSAAVSVAELLEGKRVCVCSGSGGVGKTTTSAAIALGMAARGAKVAVVTIDPAKRLANALGLEELQNEPRRVEPERLATSGLEISGELWAMMLDPKRTFDELIERIAPDPAKAQEIKANRVYRELSTAVSGSQEFTAVAKLYDLAQAGDFDLLVLDTPPSRNAVDFLDAPGRLTSFLDGRGVKAFVRPTGLGMRVLGRGASPLLSVLRKVTGVDLLTDLSTFFSLLGDMTDDFSE